jgi:hypothetical protein
VLAQTADGFPRLGTPTGLPLFYGTRFEPFHSPFGDQQTQLIRAAVWRTLDRLHVGGFSFLNDGRVINYG